MAEIELINPLDYLLLEEMPDVGSMNFGVYPDGVTVKTLREKVGGGQLTVDQIAARVRSMGSAGLAVGVKGVGTGGTNVWQRTPEGVRVLAEWRANGSH